MKVKSALNHPAQPDQYEREPSIKIKHTNTRRQAIKDSQQIHKNIAARKHSILNDQERDRP